MIMVAITFQWPIVVLIIPLIFSSFNILVLYQIYHIEKDNIINKNWFIRNVFTIILKVFN
jgi:hypothetical protein